MAKEDKKHPPILVFASDILFASIIASTVCFCQLDTRHAIFDLFKRTLAGGPRGPKCSCLVIGIFCGFLCSECFAIFFVWSKNAECTMIGLDAASRRSVFDTCGLVESLNNPLGPTHWGDEDNMENNHKKWGKSYYLMIMTVIMIPSLSLLSLTPVEDSLVILTPPMSICQYFAKNDALQQKQCIATFFGKSLWISYPLSLSQKIIWSYKRPIIYLSLLENQAVCKRASASHQRNITATPHATHNIQIDYGKSVPWVHLE